MNVKIEEQKLRFKISEDELKTLLKGNPVNAKVTLFDKILVTTINPHGRDKIMEPKLVLDRQDVYLNLLIPPTVVQELFDMGQSREGLKKEIGGISISLQVDMRGACHT